MVPTIRIDDEVFEALKQRAEPLVDSPNDVLRRVFELDRVLAHEGGDDMGVGKGSAAEPAIIDDPIMLIRIKQNYRHGMSQDELYYATHYAWRVGPRRERARLACAVFDGVIIEVWEIDFWREAEPGRDNPGDQWSKGERWEFEGRIAPESIRAKYVGRSVKSYFKRGAQSPIKYVNC